MPRNPCKKSPNVARTSSIMTTIQYLYISCVQNSTLLWDLFDALTTSHNVLSVCVQYATPQPWHVLILWSLDLVIFHLLHPNNLVLHIHIIVSMQVPYQFLKPFDSNPLIYSCRFSPIIPSIISLSFYTSSLPWFIFKTLKERVKIFGKYFLSYWLKFDAIFLWVQWSKLNSNSLD
jgi:hypothetical protein